MILVVSVAGCTESARRLGGEIHASGRATVSGAPDIAVLYLGVGVTRTSVAEARELAADALSSVVSAVKGAGVEQEDVRTSSFSIQPSYDYGSGEARFLGHEVLNVLSVTVRDVEAAGDVLDSAVAAGGSFTRVRDVTFRVADRTSLEREARRLALRDAIAKADYYAAELGVRRGRILRVSDLDGAVRALEVDRFRVSRQSLSSTSLYAGDVEVSAEIGVVVAIE